MSDREQAAADSCEEQPTPFTPPYRVLKTATARFPAWMPPLFFFVLACLFLWRSLFAGEVFLPATLLGHLAPWKSTALYPNLPPWNPLRFDGIGQFYPWRKFAAETLRSGMIPLWNPYQFCGTPFVANSQSAVLYPGNLLFVLVRDAATAFGWVACLHLTLCGWFTYLLMRRLRCSEYAALLAGVVFAYSSWQAAWLQLPTFLATSCWFPLLLLQVYSCGRTISAETGGHRKRKTGLALASCRVGAVVGLMLLAGHLQIALYGLLAGTCLAIGMAVIRRLSPAGLLTCAGGLALGLMIALPQLLPAVELSRISHRVGKPSRAGFAYYLNYALPASGLAQTLLPDFFGSDTDPANPYWQYYRLKVTDEQVIAVYHNPAETAIYVGVVPLILGLFACVRGLSRTALDRRTVFFVLLALATILFALGTPINALLYFGIPGFAQSGSPARCLVLWALAWSALAALGADRLSSERGTKREAAIVYGIAIAVVALGLNLAARSLASPPPGIRDLPSLGAVFARIPSDWIRLALFLAAGIVLIVRPGFGKRHVSAPDFLKQWAGPAALGIAVIDLFWANIGVNPTSRHDQVYPETKGIAYLREHAGHERIMPINQRWSLFAPATVKLPDVLPPNAATVFGLRDVQGYDSLFSGAYKTYANTFARPNNIGQLDASPVEVGNIVFFQNANAPGVPETAAAYAVAVPFDTFGFPEGAVPSTTPLDVDDPGMVVYELGNPEGRARLSPRTASSAVTWIEDSATRVTVEAVTPVEAAFSLMDEALPGWRLRVDGRSASFTSSATVPIGRSVAIAAGKHRIEFRYEPASFRVGLYGAAAAVFLLGVVGGNMFVSARRGFNSP